MKHLKISAALGLALAGLFAAGAASAGTATGNLAMSAQVTNSCALTGGTVSLGTVNAIAGSQTFAGQTIAVVTCNQNTAWSLNDGTSAYWNSTVMGSAPGANGGANVAMWDGVPQGGSNGRKDYLAYQIFTDPGTDKVPLGASAANAATGTGTGAAQNVNLDVIVYDANLSKGAAFTDKVPLTLSY